MKTTHAHTDNQPTNSPKFLDQFAEDVFGPDMAVLLCVSLHRGQAGHLNIVIITIIIIKLFKRVSCRGSS